jgi:hypothetical protein
MSGVCCEQAIDLHEHGARPSMSGRSAVNVLWQRCRARIQSRKSIPKKVGTNCAAR